MEDKKNFGFGTQIMKSPYFNSTVKWGATGFSVYNHMYIPRDFGNPEQNFWNLINDAILFVKDSISRFDSSLLLPWAITSKTFILLKSKVDLRNNYSVSEKEERKSVLIVPSCFTVKETL